MKINRRQFVVATANLFAIACGGNTLTSPANPTPPSQSTTLIARLKSLGYDSAQRVPYGANGAARIAINGHSNWNFFVGNSVLGIGAAENSPSIDVSTIVVPVGADLIVRNV